MIHPRAPVNGALPLFAWAAARHRSELDHDLAAVWVRRRYPMPPSRAALIAELAGLGVRQ